MNMLKLLFFIGLAGFAGTLVRYGCVRLASGLFPDFPWGTLVVNIMGAFLAGFCFVLCRCKFLQYEAYFPILFIGFLGAFTTFSTYTLESIRFFADAQYGKFAVNILLQNIAGLLAAGSGMFLAKIFFK
jgi:CrcB protein